jgi:hypothetical protein
MVRTAKQSVLRVKDRQQHKQACTGDSCLLVILLVTQSPAISRGSPRKELLVFSGWISSGSETTAGLVTG